MYQREIIKNQIMTYFINIFLAYHATVMLLIVTFSFQQRINLTAQFSALQADFDNLNARYEEESESNTTLRNQLSKINTEYSALKSRYDKELMAKTEELEDLR